MSVRVMSAVWELNLPDSEKIVLLALADCANDEGRCWPSMATLAKKCSKGERTVQGVIKSLVSKGYIERDEIVGKGCKYRVHPQPLRPAASAPRSDCPPQPATLTPAASADKPSRTIITSEAKASSVARETKPKAKFTLPSHIPAEQWAAYVEMRVKIRKPMTDYAKRLAVKELDALAADGWPPGAVLDQSTMNDWQGLFALKDRKPKAQAETGSLMDQILAGKRAA